MWLFNGNFQLCVVAHPSKILYFKSLSIIFELPTALPVGYWEFYIGFSQIPPDNKNVLLKPIEIIFYPLAEAGGN